jgi:hypothetical protein
MDIPFLDYNNCSAIEKTMLMVLERLDNVEKELSDSKKNITSLEKQYKDLLVMIIMTLDGKNSIYFDIFFYLIGGTSAERKDIRHNIINTISCLKDKIIPDRAKELHNIQNSGYPPLWRLTDENFKEFGLLDADYGKNMYKVLEALTIQEMTDYWNYRSEWTEWKTFDK